MGWDIYNNHSTYHYRKDRCAVARSVSSCVPRGTVRSHEFLITGFAGGGGGGGVYPRPPPPPPPPPPPGSATGTIYSTAYFGGMVGVIRQARIPRHSMQHMVDPGKYERTPQQTAVCCACAVILKRKGH